MAGKHKKTSPAFPMCERHNTEPITVFSLKHERCMCLKCAMTEHVHLSDFVPISEGTTLMRNQGNKLIEELFALSNTTREVKRERTKYLEKLQQSERSVRGSVKNVRLKLNRHLDMLEQKVLSKVKAYAEKSEDAFLKDRSEIQILEGDLKKMSDRLNQCLQNSNDIEMISTVVREKQHYRHCKADVSRQETRSQYKTIHFEMSPMIIAFLDNVRDLGEVSVHSEKSDKERRKHSAGVNGTPEPAPARSRSISPRKEKADTPVETNGHHQTGSVLSPRKNKDQQDFVLQTIEHDGPCNNTGVASLANGQVAVCDARHKSLQLISRKGRILDEIIFPYKPCDITTTSDHSVALTFHDKDFIGLYDVRDHRFAHQRDLTVSGKGGSYSIAYCKNRFAVCRRGEVRIISGEDGSLLNVIAIEAHYPQVAMGDSGNKIFLSDFVGGKVICLQDSGKTRWEYSSDDLEPSSIALDLNQLFVADANGRIIILSTLGLFVREIECPGNLKALCVDPTTGTVLVTQESKDKQKSRSVKIVAV